MIYHKVSNSITSDEALHITNIDFKGTSFKLILEFGISNSSMPRGTTKNKPPETLVEIYGS